MLERTLPTALVRQGATMQRALLADLAALPGVELLTLLEGRPASPGSPVLPSRVTSVLVHGHLRQQFQACVQAADAVWLVAPETDRILEYLSSEVLAAGRLLLGSHPATVRLAASKLRTTRLLANAGIATVPTYRPQDVLPEQVSAWVIKPEHGAGCLDTHIFQNGAAALTWIAAGERAYVLQPFIAGQPCSLTLLCRDGRAQLLSCNEQRVAVRDGQFHFLGSTVNAFADTHGVYARLGQEIAAAMPGLWGYVGVDFMLARQGPVVLEVNPRMTTSCAGLRASLGANPAQLVLGLLPGMDGGRAHAPLMPAASPMAVGVDVNPFD